MGTKLLVVKTRVRVNGRGRCVYMCERGVSPPRSRVTCQKKKKTMRLIGYEYRCDERLKTKNEESRRLTDTKKHRTSSVRINEL